MTEQSNVTEAMIRAGACCMDGWSGPHHARRELVRDIYLAMTTAAPEKEIVRDALNEAMRRYPDARAGLAWFAAASGMSAGEITQEVRDWAESVVAQQKPAPLSMP